MDVPKTAFFLPVTLFSVAVISEASEGQTAVKGLEKSVIIGDNPEYLAKMGEWLKPVTHSDRYWKLCWRATQHGWGVSPFHANTFHANCDGKGPTVTIVKVFSNIFGGFTSKSWGGSSGFLVDPEAFLFSLANLETAEPIKLTQRSGYSIYAADPYGPTFGTGFDLHIVDYANGNSDSFANLGGTYQVPPGVDGKTFLAGSYHFTPSEIETFYHVTS